MIIKILKYILIVICALLLLVMAGLGVLTILEYRPDDIEQLEPEKAAAASSAPAPGDSLRIVTWNTGYGALGDNADFFMDGGSHVFTADRERVLENLEGMAGVIDELSPDILLLQEADRDSSRSYHIDALDYFNSRESSSFFPGTTQIFAANFKAFVPYPLPPIGKVYSGLITVSSMPVREAVRIQLPCPFSWPVRIANLKRCLLVSRIPLEGSDKELVVVNLHLEAYDSGEGKVAQTAQLADFLSKERASGNYVVTGGDFNQVFSSVDISAYPKLEGKWECGEIAESDFGEGFSFVMDNRVPSCRSIDIPLAGAAETDPSHFQYYLLDGFILSDNITVDSCETIDKNFRCSDHNPVVISLTLNN